MYRFGMGDAVSNDPVAAYADMLSGKQIDSSKYSQGAITAVANLYNLRNVILPGGKRQIEVDTATLQSGGLPALYAALAGTPPVSSTVSETWDQLHVSDASAANYGAPVPAIGTTLAIPTAPVAAPVASVTPTPAPVTANAQLPAIAPGVSLPAQATPSVAPVAGFSISSIPMWGWAAAAGVALFAFQGGKYGR